MHRRARRGLCGAGRRPRRVAHALRLFCADLARGRAVQPEIHGRRHSEIRRRRGPHQFRHRHLAEARQQCPPRKNTGGAGQPLCRAGAVVLDRNRRAAGDLSRRRHAAHAGRRRQWARRQISGAPRRHDGRHPRLRLAGRRATHGGLRGARHRDHPLLQPQCGKPRHVRAADERSARRRRRSGRHSPRRRSQAPTS